MLDICTEFRLRHRAQSGLACEQWFWNPSDYKTYHLISYLFTKTRDVVHDLQYMARKAAVQLYELLRSCNDSKSVRSFLQNFKSAYNEYGIRGGGGMLLFDQ